MRPPATDYATLWTAYFFNVANANMYNTLDIRWHVTRVVSSCGTGTTPTLTNVAGLDRLEFGIYGAIAGDRRPMRRRPTPTLQTGYVSAPYALVRRPDREQPWRLRAARPAIATVYNTTSSANLMTAAVSGKGSFSYDFVGGALFNADGTSSVNPNAVVQLSSLSSTVTGNVTIDQHTSYTDPLNSLTVYVPTLVRTGTGSITIAAAGDFALLDTRLARCGLYGRLCRRQCRRLHRADRCRPSSVSSGVLTNPVWATGGGNITITAGRDIIGIETPTDPGNAYSTNGSSAGVSTGQFWSQWYYVNGKSTGSATAPFDPSAGGVQYSSWINYGTFFQGFGALGGGNITLKAGRNVQDVSASLPETIQVSGGQSATGPAATAHYYGGGNLLVEAGNDVLSGVYYVGRGTGLIRAGGKMVSDATLYQTNYNSNNAPTITDHRAGAKPVLGAAAAGGAGRLYQRAGGGRDRPRRHLPADASTFRPDAESQARNHNAGGCGQHAAVRHRRLLRQLRRRTAAWRCRASPAPSPSIHCCSLPAMATAIPTRCSPTHSTILGS